MKRLKPIDRFFELRSRSGSSSGENTNAINNNDQSIEPVDKFQ